MIRTFIICQQEPFFIPKQVKLILENAGKNYEVNGATLLSPARKGYGLRHWFRERARVYRKKELALVLLGTTYCKLSGAVKRVFGGTDPYSAKERFQEYGVPIIPYKDIADPSYLEKIRQLAPDVIISISSPQLFDRNLLNLPTRYCLNLHASLLPRHRGVFGTWWTLYEAEEKGGASIHTMEEKLDAGSLLWQEAHPIHEQETQFSLAETSKRRMAEGLVKLLRQIDRGEERTIAPSTTPSYNRAPTREEGKTFKRTGKRIIRTTDLERALQHKFAKKGGEDAQ